MTGFIWENMPPRVVQLYGMSTQTFLDQGTHHWLQQLEAKIKDGYVPKNVSENTDGLVVGFVTLLNGMRRTCIM